MTTSVNGFHLEVTDEGGLHHVRVSLKDGTVVLDTAALSITGLENLQGVLGVAARMAYQQTGNY